MYSCDIYRFGGGRGYIYGETKFETTLQTDLKVSDSENKTFTSAYVRI